MAIKLVVAGTLTPAESVQHAQVVIVTGESWHIIAPMPYKFHSFDKRMAVPKVACPVIDVSGFSEEQNRQGCEIIMKCTDSVAGVINMAGLLTGMEALGATIVRPPVAKATSPQISATPSI